jgi:intracellular sulfur oxidation DsrE/DsrF family protein
MKRRNIVTAAAGASAVYSAAGSASAGAAVADDAQRVVYHVTSEKGPEGRNWRPILGNMENHLDAVGDDKLTLVAVLNAGGLGLLRQAAQDTALQQRIAAPKRRGVRFRVCRNSMRAMELTIADLFDVQDADLVQAGVVEVVRWQQDGFAYLRP